MARSRQLVCGAFVLGLAAAVPGAAPPSQPNPVVRITLGAPTQIFHYRQPDALGLFNVPDMHTVVLDQSDKSYLVWITGNIGPTAGAIAMLTTKDFLHYKNAGPGTPSRAEPVLTPTCRTSAPSGPRGRGRGRRGSPSTEPVPSACLQNYDADYVGANAVVRARNSKDLLLFYQAGNKSVGDTTIGHGWEYNVVALARSSDNGATWKREGIVLSGTDPRPTKETETAQPGISEFGAVVANDFLYMFFQYVPNSASSPDAPSVIQVARAPLSSDGVPNSWTKYYQGAFSQPGLGGRGSPIVATGQGTGCTRPVEVGAAFSSYLNAHVLTFVCNEGWFFSTSKDLVTWAPPKDFMPMTMWRACQPMDWNYVLVTPGNAAGVVGETGDVLYAHSDSKGLGCTGGFSPHELWMRPFKFSMGP
jgi:hypothetical protein